MLEKNGYKLFETKYRMYCCSINKMDDYLTVENSSLLVLK